MHTPFSFDPRDVSLVITAHRDGPMLRECLAGVSRLCPVPGEVIVAIDGACPIIQSVAMERGFSTVVQPSCPGVSATRNAGAGASRGRWIAFLDSDVVPEADFVKMAFEALASQPGSVAAFGSYDDDPAARGVISRYRNLLHHFTHQQGKRDAQTFWAACGICDARIFREAGGFDEGYRSPSIEDIALGYALRRSGHRIALDPRWQIKHLKKWTWRDLVFTDIGRRAIPWTLLLLREGRLDNDLNIDSRSRWSALLVLASLVALPAAMVWPWLLPLPVACVVFAVFLNRCFYRFLARKAGWGFAFASMPFHLFYYLAAAIGYGLACVLLVFSRGRPPSRGKEGNGENRLG